MSNITITECKDFSGINKMLKDLYWEMVIDQTEGMVMQLQESKEVHVFKAVSPSSSVEALGTASGKMSGIMSGKIGYMFTIGTDAHALFPLESHGKWALDATRAALEYVKSHYGVSRLTSGHYSCFKHAGFFLNRLGFKRENVFNTGKTKDREPISYITYSMEIK